jgi:plastocyanin
MNTTFRAMMAAAALGAAVAPLLAAVALPVQAQNAPTAVSIDNFTFTPQTLTVKAGTTVIWANKDDIPHGIAWIKNAFTKSKALDTDDTYALTFNTPGTYAYFCYLHPHMTGTLVVEAATGDTPR